MLRAVVINDTRGHNHFGCHRVMETIEDNLARRGITVVARSLVRQRWWENTLFLEAMEKSDLILINGEGTLHHGARHGEEILKIAVHPRRGRIPVALVNALYQDNPVSWISYITKIDFIAARDSRSAGALGAALGRMVPNTLDFSLAGRVFKAEPEVGRRLLLIGESVDRNTGRSLVDLASQRSDATFLPIMTTLKGSRPQSGKVMSAFREAYIHSHTFLFRMVMKNMRLCSDLNDFLSVLSQAYLHITGRFHGVCLALVAGTPFVAVKSNSWKMETLLHDIGLGSRRLMDVAQVAEFLGESGAMAFDESERAAIAAALEYARREADAAFDAIKVLAVTYSEGRAKLSS